MTQVPSNDDNLGGLMRREALQASRDAVWKVIQEHKRLGMPLTTWRDGRVIEVSPEEAEYLAAKAKAIAEGDYPAPPAS